jgi:hypothetical protein
MEKTREVWFRSNFCTSDPGGERARLAVLPAGDVTFERGPVDGHLREVSRGHFPTVAAALSYADARCVVLLRAGWLPFAPSVRVMCAWCGAEKVAGTYGPRPAVKLTPLPGEAISHGLCPTCDREVYGADDDDAEAVRT